MEDFQFLGTTTLTVAEDFNLKTYLKELVKVGKKEKDASLKTAIAEADLGSYILQNEGTVFLQCNTAHQTNNSKDVWDWLIEQFLPIMTCKLAQRVCIVIDTEEGVDYQVSFLDKDNKFIFTDELVNMYDPAALEREI